MIKAVLILFLSLATFINAKYYIEQTAPYACMLRAGRFEGDRQLVGKQGAVGCKVNGCVRGADVGIDCAPDLKCKLTGDPYWCRTACFGDIQEGTPCKHGPCGKGLACIRGTCQKYDRTAYLKGEYAYDHGDCAKDSKFCLNKYDSCVAYNQRYNENNVKWYTALIDYCAWPNKCVANPNFNINGLPRNTSTCYCDGKSMPIGSNCLNAKCGDGHECFEGKCIKPTNIGKKCNSKETNCLTTCASSWKDDTTKICQSECSLETQYCNVDGDCCNDYYCTNNKCVGCNKGPTCDPNHRIPCCNGICLNGMCNGH